MTDKAPTIPNPFKSLPVIQRLQLRAMMPTVWPALEALWREGYMSDQSEKNVAILTTLMQVHAEVNTVVTKLQDKIDPEQGALVQSILAGGAFMAGVRLAQEMAAVPLVWAVAEEAEDE